MSFLLHIIYMCHHTVPIKVCEYQVKIILKIRELVYLANAFIQLHLINCSKKNTGRTLIVNKCNKIVQLSFILLLLTQGIEQFHQHKNQYFEDLPTFLLFPLAIFNNRQPVFWPLLVWFFYIENVI